MSYLFTITWFFICSGLSGNAKLVMMFIKEE